ncbi:MAG: hypothetical protein E7271_00300 [Lachnospiraceae bacterium]|nr:hypothetical protein [Lachnospiraceae bacterium]
MKKRIITVFIVLAALFCFIPKCSSEAAGKITKKKAYKAYYKWMESDEAKTEVYNRKTKEYSKIYYTEYALLDINGDKVKELIALYKDREGTHINRYVICHFNGKKVNTLIASSGVSGVGGYRGGTVAVPPKGVIAAHSISSGTGSKYDTYYKMTKAGFKEIYSLTYDRSYTMEGETISYIINHKKASKKEYNKLKKKLDKKYSNEKDIDDLKYVSRKKMLKKLK